MSKILQGLAEVTTRKIDIDPSSKSAPIIPSNTSTTTNTSTPPTDTTTTTTAVTTKNLDTTYAQVRKLIDQLDNRGKQRVIQALKKTLGVTDEQLNELSNDTLGQYKTAAGADAKKADSEGDYKRGDKRFSGIVKATKKQFDNDAKKVKEDKWDPITGGDFPTDYTSGDTTPSPAKFQAMLDYHGNNMNVIRALDDLYRNAQSGSYYDSTVRADRYLATIENRFGKSEKRYFPTKREAYEYAKGYNSVVTSIEKIDKEEDTSDLITLPVMLGIKDHKKKWMLQFPSEAYAQKWEFKHKNVAKILWDEQHALYSPEPEAKPETEKDQEDDEPGKYGYDTETGKPLKKGEQSSRPQQGNRPQQSSRPQQYHTSQQVGYTKPSKYNKDDVTDVEVKEAGNQMIQGELMPVTRQYWQKAVVARYPDAKFFQQKMMNGATIARDESGQVGIYDPKNSYAKVGPSDESTVEEAYNNYHANRTGFSKPNRDLSGEGEPEGMFMVIIDGRPWKEFTSNMAFARAKSFATKNPDRKVQVRWPTGELNTVTEELDENLHKWFKEKWVRFGPDGKIRGDCARGDDSEGKPKCLPQSKAQNLGKKGRASAAARKRREDPNPERSGKAINVNTKKKSNESLREFAPMGSGDNGDDGFDDNTLKILAAQWWNGDEDPKVEKTLAAAGWEIGQDEGYDNGGVFVVRAGDVNGNSYMSWPAEELTALSEACWKGYHKEGNKKMFGKTYPNCVKNTNEEQEIEEGWKDVVAGSALALSTLGAGAQTMPNINVQQVELANKYYNVLVQRAKEDGRELDTRTLNMLKAKAQDAAAKKLQQSTPQQSFPTQGNERRVAKDANQFEAQHNESCPHCGGEMVSEELMNEKKDACYYKVKSRYKVWPSAYASGALVKCRKKGADSWGNGGKKNEGVAEGSAKDRQWSNKDMERLRVATKDFDDIMASDGPDQTKHDLIKKRIQTKPMTGPKGQLPKQGVAEDQLDEKWTKKYKDSINCSNPKGFSQKAHCAGKQKNESAIMKGLKL